MNELQDCILGDLVEFQRGYDLPKDAFVKGEYPVQSSNGILGYHNEYKVKAPGITIGRSGTVGIPHLITKNFFPHNTALYVKDFKGNNVQYIYYLLKNLKLNEYKTGSGVPTMNRNHLHPLKIRAFTNLKTQQSIAAVLSALDKKSP
ncbi:restriction endonuclease subunit S [Aggregatibacter actinomycetemcomitans]|uniref:restriction endonuclease subunit S n=1 Tax=Aggregatibacter actinomycetemcomitans TaxID=714 RepID=UPI000A420E80|nr:restriction endonuclease subunit S [Aggregatibacter actinomycetemcomitans]